ncbi:NUDIX domain-containing protein [Actinacidiphila glaucinigra]|uniref:NUDIX domain-containing protein n=1 Tax=Actinacidiphila glaucinigra TaxID=235986 RepID=UPI003D8BC71A
MTEPQLQAPGFEILDVRDLRLLQGAAPMVSTEHQVAQDRVWDAAVAANPDLFDGPVVACAGVEWDGPRRLILTWAQVTYRHYALRRVPGASALPSLFVNVVQPTDDGRIMAARMSSSTAAPGRWQLPGGSVEPPQEHEVLDEAGLCRNAARELVEETGLDTVPGDLQMWAVTRGENASIGVVYLAPPRPEAVLLDRFEAVAAAERACGREPELELDRVALVRSVGELAELSGPHADYLAPIVRRYSESLLRRGA